MGLGPLYIQAHKSLGRPVFTSAMSRSARIILDTVLQPLITRGVELGGANPLLEAFAADFNPIVYEDAALGWNLKELLAKIKASVLFKTKKQTTQAELISVACLAPLYSKEWSISLNAQGVQFRLSHSAAIIEVYSYVTSNFLLDDFGDYDAIKLIEIARGSTLEEIQEVCRRIDQPEKKNIVYLYRAVKNADVVDKVINDEIKDRFDESMKVIAEMWQTAHAPKIPITYDPNWNRDARVTEAMRTGIWPKDLEF